MFFQSLCQNVFFHTLFRALYYYMKKKIESFYLKKIKQTEVYNKLIGNNLIFFSKIHLESKILFNNNESVKYYSMRGKFT